MNDETKQIAERDLKRSQLLNDFKSIYEDTLPERVDRYLEIAHQDIIPNHYFAAASTQCIDLYKDGYFISAVMVTQAVHEGIMKLIAERNGIRAKLEHSVLVRQLVRQNVISNECAAASNRIWTSFRNDVHHMNPKVTEISFDALSKRNLLDLAFIEKEIFAVDVTSAGLVPKQPKYWDVAENGTVSVFLRLI